MTDRPLRPSRQVEEGAFGGQRLARILGAPMPPDVPIALLHDRVPPEVYEDRQLGGLTWIDTRLASPRWTAADDTALHLLWSRPDRAATVEVWQPDADESIEHPWAPGDFLLVQAGTSYRLGAGAVAVIVERQGESAMNHVSADPVLARPITPVQPSSAPPSPPDRLFAPSHGLSVFDGYNRQTFGIATPSLAVTRWKVTQPQSLPVTAQKPVWLANLAAPLTIAWPGGLQQLERVETRLIPTGLPLTVYPDDLGYLLLAWVPDLEREVIPPLRAAGYTRADITSLGVPPTLLP